MKMIKISILIFENFKQGDTALTIGQEENHI